MHRAQQISEILNYITKEKDWINLGHQFKDERSRFY
jgi:hypothetical protein